ncbi:MAG TPA: transcriptional regulator [Actinobacteria bacterium]|nr:transcriptional regulator [Actinomycetota bacterium]
MTTATETLQGDEELSLVFSALGNPTRRSIVRRLALGPATVSVLAEPFRMTLPAVSKHISLLERAGLVHLERRGRSRLCTLRAGAIVEAESWLESCRVYWTDTLDSLARHLEDGDAPQGGS